jgi:regulatory protein
MEVLSVTHYKGRAYCVEMSDGNKYYLHQNIIGDYSICKGMEVDERKLAEIMSASYKRRAYERALYLLDYRDYSYIEMLEKLEQNYPEGVCRETVDRLASCGLINDRRYAENLAEKYCQAKKYGLYRARQEIMRHGVDRELADEVLEPYEEGIYERIKAVIEKKYAQILLENPDRKNKVRVTGALVRLGYGYDDIKEVLEDFIDENYKED